MSSVHSALPGIHLLPLYRALPRHQPLTLDLLVTVTPPLPKLTRDRVPLNLSLVIDRSGSMQGEKIHYAQMAARFAVEHLLPSDRLSVVLFDHQVETLVASTLATDKARVLAQIAQIRTRGSTDLHGGWLEGGVQVSQYLHKERLNRVIILSDGLTNVGETRLDTIASHVQGLAQMGVSTTTLGIGDDYDENLLAAMALSGEGNFVHIQTSTQLPEIFETELAGLVATLGQRVRLTLKTQIGVKVLSVLNDFDVTPEGDYKLPNLLVGVPIQVVVRLQIPAQTTPQKLLGLQLSWQNGGGDRQVIKAVLALPLVEPDRMADFPAHPLVQEQVALLTAARARREAISLGDRGDYAGARQVLKDARLSMVDLPISAHLTIDATLLEELELAYEEGQSSQTRKRALSQAYNLSRQGKSDPRRSM